MEKSTFIKIYVAAFLFFGVFALTNTSFAQGFTATQKVLPSGVDILWEADVYTPPFYKGKGLATRQSTIRFVAIPEATFGAPQDLHYTWRLGTRVLGNESGINRQTLVLEQDIISRIHTVIVEVRDSTGDSAILAAASVNVPQFQPQLVLYENNPLLGVLFGNELESSALLEEEITVEAYPFFFSSPKDNGDLIYTWAVNDGSSEEQSGSRITLRRGEESGRATVSLVVQNSQRILQSASAFFSLDF